MKETLYKIVQNKLLVDIKRFKIITYEKSNKWFNNFHIGYLLNNEMGHF